MTPNVSLIESDPRLQSSDPVYWSSLSRSQLTETPIQAFINKGTRVVHQTTKSGVTTRSHCTCQELKECHQDPVSFQCLSFVSRVSNLCFDTSLRQEVNFLVTGGLTASLYSLSDTIGMVKNIFSLVFEQTYWRGMSWPWLGHRSIPESITVALEMGHFGWVGIIGFSPMGTRM